MRPILDNLSDLVLIKWGNNRAGKKSFIMFISSELVWIYAECRVFYKISLFFIVAIDFLPSHNYSFISVDISNYNNMFFCPFLDYSATPVVLDTNHFAHLL